MENQTPRSLEGGSRSVGFVVKWGFGSAAEPNPPSFGGTNEYRLLAAKMEHLSANTVLWVLLAGVVGVVLGWLGAALWGGRARGGQDQARQQQLDRMRAASEAAAREVRRLKASLVESEADRADLRASLDASEDKVARRDRTIAKLTAEMHAAKADLSGLNELQHRMDQHRARLVEFERLRVELERKTRELADVEAVRAELAESRRRVEELEAAHAALAETESDLTAELAHASSALGALQEQLAEASSEKTKLDAAVHRIRVRQQSHPLAGEIQSKAEEIANLRARLAAKEQTIAKLRSELEDARRRLLSASEKRPQAG